MTDLISRAEAIEAVCNAQCELDIPHYPQCDQVKYCDEIKALLALPSADAEKKKAELKENGDWDCPDVYCDECDHHRSVEWCSLAIPNHEEIDDTYKMVTEAFFEGFESAEKRYRLLIEILEELEEKSAESEWIPCSERLPSEDAWEWYLVTIKGYESFVDVVPFDDALWKGLVSNQEIIAWMPLPKPYRGDGEA